MPSITGSKEVRDALKAYAKKVRIIKKQCLMDMGHKIGEISSDSVPVELGILKSTYTVKSFYSSVLAGYNTEYAAYQHQGMRKDGTRIIRNRPGGGQSFFLSEPLQKNTTQLVSFFNERLKHYTSKF